MRRRQRVDGNGIRYREWAPARRSPRRIRRSWPAGRPTRCCSGVDDWADASPPLIVDQFIQSQPWHVLRTGATAYWTVFPVARSAAAARQWIARNGPFDRVDVALFNHGVDSAGLAPIDDWMALTGMGEVGGRLLGQRPGRFPADFAALARTGTALRRLPDGPPWPTLPIGDLAAL